MEKDSILRKKNIVPLLVSLLNGRRKMSELLDVIPNYMTIKSYIGDLEKEGYVRTEEKFEGRKVIYVELTEKGKYIAEILKDAELASKLTPEEIERFANMRAFIHINTFEDHITVMDVHLGRSRIANIYAKPRGDIVYFWCDLHNSDDCYHIEYVFADPSLSNFVRKWINKNGYKLAKKYQKYIDEYW